MQMRNNIFSINKYTSTAVCTVLLSGLLLNAESAKSEEHSNHISELLTESEVNLIDNSQNHPSEIQVLEEAVNFQETIVSEITNYIEFQNQMVEEVAPESEVIKNNEVYKQEINSSEEQLSEYREHIEKTEDRIGLLETELIISESRLSEINNQLYTNDIQNKDTIDKKQRLETIHESISETNKQITENQQSLLDLKREMSGKDSIISSKENTVRKTGENIQELNKTINSLSLEIEKHDAEKNNLLNHIDKITFKNLENQRNTNVIPFDKEFLEYMKHFLITGDAETSKKLELLGREILNREYQMPITGNLEDFYIIQETKIGDFTEKEENTIIHPNYLTAKERLELAQFVISTINPLRAEMGLQPFEVDEDMMNVSDKITKLSNKFKGHDMKALEQISKDIVIKTVHFSEDGTKIRVPNSIENIISEVESYILSEGERISMAEFKKQLLWKMIGSIYYDAHANWEHTRILLDPNTSSIGISFNADSTQYPIDGHLYTEFRFNSIDNRWYPFTDFKRIIHQVPSKEESAPEIIHLKQKVADLEVLLDNKKTKKEEFDSEVKKFQKEYEVQLKDLEEYYNSKNKSTTLFLNLTTMNKDLVAHKSILELKRDSLVSLLEGAVSFKKQKEILSLEQIQLIEDIATIKKSLVKENIHLSKLKDSKRRLQEKITNLKRKTNSIHSENNTVLSEYNLLDKSDRLNIWNKFLKQEKEQLNFLQKELVLEKKKVEQTEDFQQVLVEADKLSTIPSQSDNYIVDSQSIDNTEILTHNKRLPSTNHETNQWYGVIATIILGFLGVSKKRKNLS